MIFKDSENRKDFALREAINKIQELLVSGRGKALVYQQVLECAASLMDCEYSLIYQVVTTSDHLGFYFQHQVGGDFNSGDSKRTTTESFQHWTKGSLVQVPLDSYWANFLKDGLSKSYDSPLSKDQLNIFPENHPIIKNALFVPLTVQGHNVGVICLSNKVSPFSGKDIKRLSPLWITFEVVVRSMAQEADVTIEGIEGAEAFYAKNYFGLSHASLNGIIAVDNNFCITSINSAAEKIFATNSKKATGLTLCQFIPDCHSLVAPELATGIPTKTWSNVEALTDSGNKIALDISGYRVSFYGKVYVTYIFENITSRIESNRLFQENDQRFTALTHLAPVGIIQVDCNWDCTYGNEKWCELSGLSYDDLLNQGWLNAIHLDDVEEVLSKLHLAISHDQAFDEEFRLQTPLGILTWVKTNARSLYDEAGNTTGFLATFTDITEQRKVESQLRELAEYDPLTGLLNRTFFNSHLQSAFDRSGRSGNVILLFLDLDGFKEINDTLGHDVGDELLKKVAIRIKRSVREEDTVARIGGDEFTVILSALKDDIDASKVAQKIVEAVRPPFNVCGNEIFITISIGIAVGDTQNSDGKLLTKQADTALYRAKNLGRNTFQFFTPELDAKAKDKLFISNSLHRALDANEFELYYQPQVDVKGDMIVGFEALLRWHHPTSGELEPDRFIPLLEETGLINPVGRWIFNTASNQMKLWLDDGLVSPESTMSVNLSVHQMRDNEFPLFVASAIKSLDLAAKHLIIEITETSLMADNPRILTFLQALQQLGIKISMDDFGTGYSSLSYLKKFPIDHLKIDRSFIADILDDPSDASIVQAIIAMARSLGLTIIAEGVDAQDKLKILRNLGCDIYQGYFYSKPLPAKEIEDRFLIPQQKLALSPHNSNIYRTGKSSNSKLH